SGIIAANINNALGIAGIAPNAQIMPLRVLNRQGVGTYSDVASAIIYAVDHGAQVINLSLGGPNPSSMLQEAIDYAIARNVVIVASAGNTGSEQVLYPALYEPVISVGAVDQNAEHSSFSAYGAQVDIYAPGRDILTTGMLGDYVTMTGTSLSAPFVTGAIVVEQSLNRTLVTNHGTLYIYS
ncbi:MAG TPA: S8 family serine peptidase, partial [Aggregatilineales bacterium]|nr:S8 family serine peptidase [Aggregatilineales bacterium]